jgi:hypothetical protein
MTITSTTSTYSNFVFPSTRVEANIEQVQSQSRENIDILNNETPSHIPRFFLNISQQEDYAKPITDLFDASLALIKPKELFTYLQNDISDHIEMRFQLFFSQLLLSYQEKFVFEQFKTLSQAGIKNKKGSSCDLVEAHSSTLPNLSFVDQQEEELHFTSLTNKPLQPHIYAVHTSFQKKWNTTVKLPSFVNKVDSKIDKLKLDGMQGVTFRAYAIKILNYNASGKSNPQIGLIRFIEAFNRVIENLYTKEVNKAKKLIEKVKTVKESEKSQLDEKIEKLTLTLLSLDNYYSVAKSYLKQSKEQDFFHKLTFNGKEAVDVSYFLIQKSLSTKSNYESYLWKEFNAFQEHVFSTILPFNTQNKSALVKCLFLRIILKCEEIKIINKYVEQLEQEPPGEQAKNYLTRCINNKKIQEQCVSYLDSKTTTELENEFKRLTSSRPKFSPHLQLLKTSILAQIGLDRIKNSQWITIKLIHYSIPFSKKIKTSLLSLSVQHFFHINYEWANQFYSKINFIVNMENLLKNKELVEKSNLLIEKMINYI